MSPSFVDWRIPIFRRSFHYDTQCMQQISDTDHRIPGEGILHAGFKMSPTAYLNPPTVCYNALLDTDREDQSAPEGYSQT